MVTGEAETEASPARPEPVVAAEETEAKGQTGEAEASPDHQDTPPIHHQSAVTAIMPMEPTLGTVSSHSPVPGRTRSPPGIEDQASLTEEKFLNQSTKKTELVMTTCFPR